MTSTCRILTACAAVAAAGFAVTPQSAAGQTPDLETVVDSFYPAALTEISLKAGLTPVREHCFAVLESDAAGNARVIVAAYTNHYVGAVRVLQADGAGFRLVAEPAGEDQGGWACEVKALDVDLDGRNEAHVSFTGRGSEDWVYAWDGQQLLNLTPVTVSRWSGALETELINASFIDTDGDGLPEILTFSQVQGDETPLPEEIYRLSNGRFVFDRAVVEVEVFDTANVLPVRTVRTPVGARGPFTLRVVNGTGGGTRVRDAVDSGRVWLNGEEIIRPTDFGPEITVIERTVNLKAENELRVQLAGARDAQITIVIDAASWAPKKPGRAP